DADQQRAFEPVSAEPERGGDEHGGGPAFLSERSLVDPRRAEARDREDGCADEAREPRARGGGVHFLAHCRHLIVPRLQGRAGTASDPEVTRSERSRGRSNGKRSSATRGSVNALLRNSSRSRCITALMLNEYVPTPGMSSRSSLGGLVT